MPAGALIGLSVISLGHQLLGTENSSFGGAAPREALPSVGSDLVRNGPTVWSIWLVEAELGTPWRLSRLFDADTAAQMQDDIAAQGATSAAVDRLLEMRLRIG